MEENESLQQTEEVVTPQQGDEGAAQGAEGEQSTGAAGRDRQSHEDNRRYAAARRSGEQAGYDRAMRDVNDRIKRAGMRDPGSGETISDIEGLEAYTRAYKRQLVEQRAQSEGRSVAEVQAEEDDREFLRDLRSREAAERSAREEEKRVSEFARRDALAFMAAYPDVDLGQLDEDKAFRRFCGSRYGREPLSELYEDYLEIAGSAAQAAEAKAGSRNARSTGAGGSGGSEALTASQQRELDEWNRTYPHMKMTAKEFLSR